MNSNFMLQNLIENGGGTAGEHRSKKGGRGQSHELEMQVGTVFNEAGEKVGLLKGIVVSLLKRLCKSKESKLELEPEEKEETNVIVCEDCQNYEASLQKLEQ